MISQKRLHRAVCSALPLLAALTVASAPRDAYGSGAAQVSQIALSSSTSSLPDRDDTTDLDRIEVRATAPGYDPWWRYLDIAFFEKELFGGRTRFDTTSYETGEPEGPSVQSETPDLCSGALTPTNTKDPVAIQSGNKVRQDVDIHGEGEMALGLTRYYSAARAMGYESGWFGKGWVSNLEMRITEGGAPAQSAVEHPALQEDSPDTAAAASDLYVQMPMGRIHRYSRVPGNQARPWQTPGDSFTWVVREGGVYVVRRADDSYIRFEPNGMVKEVGNAHGQKWLYEYENPGPQQTVTISSSSRQTLTLEFSNGLVQNVRVVLDSYVKQYDYAYTSSGDLQSVDFPGALDDTLEYHYEALLGHASVLSGLSFGGLRHQTYTYWNNNPDDFLRYGRVRSTELAGGVERLEFDYSRSFTSDVGFEYTTHITNSEGLTSRYKYRSVPSAVRGASDTKLVSVDRDAFTGCEASAASYTYDVNGHLDVVKDFNNVSIDYDYNANGQLTGKTEGISAQTPLGLRRTTYLWDAKDRPETRVQSAPSPWGERTGCSPDQTAPPSALRPSCRCWRRPRPTAMISMPGSRTC